MIESQVLDEMPNLSSDGLEARAELSVRKAEKEVLEQNRHRHRHRGSGSGRVRAREVCFQVKGRGREGLHS